MGFFSDHLFCDYDGNRIEVEGNVGGLACLYRLIIEGQKVDQIEMNLGTASLRGQLSVGKERHNVKVEIRQGPFGANFKLFIDEREHFLQKIK